MYRLFQTEDVDIQTGLPGPIADRRFSALRLALALAALVIVFLDPPGPERYSELTYGLLVVYAIYSLSAFAIGQYRMNFSRSVLHAMTWGDLGVYTVLIALGGGANSVFFVFYFFPVIVASSRGGVRLGLKITVMAALLYMGVGLGSTPIGEIELNRFLLRPFTIIALGYILTYWGGAELELKKRLGLLKELSLVANPRLGVDWTIELILRRLLHFWDAHYCLILLANDTGLRLYLLSDDDPGQCQNVDVRGQFEVPFIDVTEPAAEVFSDRRFSWQRKTYRSFDPETHEMSMRPPAPGEAIAEFLDARSYVGVPLHYRERYRGRLLVSSREPHAFDVSDAIFLEQVARQVLPVIENIRLVDRLASDASEEERNRIARSVHDRVIQPYYGLQIGLKALHRLLQSKENGAGPGSEEQHSEQPVALLSELMSMTSDGINELRAYVSGLKQSKSSETGLADSIRRFAAKFEHATGIHVKIVDSTNGFVGNSRLTSEMFQMAAEALSNVHRHTPSRSARVSLNLEGEVIRLQVENELGKGVDPVPFMPGTISDRAEALGGRTDVSWVDGRTVLSVEIPL